MSERRKFLSGCPLTLNLAVYNMPEGEIEPLQIHDKCEVQWRGGLQTLPAVVVERRPKGFRKRKKSEPLPDLETLKADEIEYYIHYVDHDRRLDEWLTLDQFQLDTLERHVADEAVVEESIRGLARRRSSASLGGTSADLQQPQDGTAASATELLTHGGNWHGTSGDPALAAFEREHEETTKVKNIEKIIMGEWEVEAWYYSPFPDSYCNLETLYVCEYCLSYMKKIKTFRRHKTECSMRRPPGRGIYKEGDLAVYELDGKEPSHRVYCQKLCLLAKLFLDHKTLYYDVTPFYFYVVCKLDEKGSHIVGYFSKEKLSNEGYNLACILTFPQYQQSGYGKFIISLSYELTKREGKTGSPEKPLSDLGKVSYRSYWTYVLMNLFANHDTSKDISINDMTVQTGIKTEDIISTLQSLDMIEVWKGQHVVHVKQAVVREYMEQGKQLRLCKSEFLNWEPPAGSADTGNEN